MVAWRSFISRNLIIIVMVPVIIGSHYTWYKLQKDDRLVSAQERKKLPFSSLLFGHRTFSLKTVSASEWADYQEFTDQKYPSYTAEDFSYNFW